MALRDHRDLVVRAEAAGYTDLWTGETNGPDGFTPLAIAAAWTERVRLGTGVVGVFQRGPALLAQEAAALADGSGGRFALGIGASSDRIVEGWNQIPFERPLLEGLRDGRLPQDRVRRRAHADRLQARAGAGRARFRSSLAALRGQDARSSRSRRPTARSPTSCRSRACRRCARASTAPPEDFELLCRFFCVPGEREQVEPLARFMFSSYITVPVYATFYRWLGHGDAIAEMCEAWEAKDRQRAAEAAPWELIEEMFILGTPEQMRARLDEFVEGGITLPVLTPITTPDKMGELIEALAP